MDEEEIVTHYVKGGFAQSDDIVLSETKTTRTVFRPAVHQGGVRGWLIRQKIAADGRWAEVNEVNFRTMPPDCGVSVELDTTATTRLFQRLQQLQALQQQGVGPGDQHYVVANKEKVVVIDDQSKATVIKELLAHGYTLQVWQALVEADTDLATRLAAGQIQLHRRRVVDQFAEALAVHRGDESFWQSFFEANPWLLQAAFSSPVFMLAGETYVGGKRPIGRQGQGGVATDFLFADDSTKSFAVVDIKTPGTPLVGGVYRGRQESGQDGETYSMSSELSGSIVQVRNQITVAIENFTSVLSKIDGASSGFDGLLNRVHPKGVLVVGELKGLDERQVASFNQFRHGQYSLTIITFDELLRRLTILYDDEASS